MKTRHATRLVVVSMMGIGESRAQAPLWYRYLLMPTFLRASTKDKTALEAEVKSSGLEYIIVRPPILKDGPPTGSVKLLAGGEKGHSITRADLAEFLVTQLDSPENVGREVTVVNK